MKQFGLKIRIVVDAEDFEDANKKVTRLLSTIPEIKWNEIDDTDELMEAKA
jgi:hypothetical protein